MSTERAIALGMDGVNNAVIPGHATPRLNMSEKLPWRMMESYNQKAILAYAEQSFAMIQELESWGVKFQKTATADYSTQESAPIRVAMVLPMPEGYDIKKLLTRAMRRVGVKTENRVMRQGY